MTKKVRRNDIDRHIVKEWARLFGFDLDVEGMDMQPDMFINPQWTGEAKNIYDKFIQEKFGDKGSYEFRQAVRDYEKLKSSYEKIINNKKYWNKYSAYSSLNLK